MLVRYDSLREFAASLPEVSRHHDANDFRSWSGGRDYAQCRKAMWEGDSAALAASDKLLDQVEADGIELRQESWDTDLIGYFPCVPAAVSGDPECMFLPVDEQSNTAPMRVYVDLFISAAWSPEDLVKRGVAVLALVRKLAMIRPVELYALFASRSRKGQFTTPIIRLETNPLDLTTASYLFGNPGFFRMLVFAWMVERGVSQSIPWHTVKRRDIPGIAPEDLLLDGVILGRDCIDDPVAWVNEHVAKYACTVQAS